jgi:hypothetical protein
MDSFKPGNANLPIGGVRKGESAIQENGGPRERLGTETPRLESIYRRTQAALDALQKSLLHEAFHGEL